MFKGVRADVPTRRHLRHWERVCVYLDGQPFRSVRHPLPRVGEDVPPMTTRLLKRMAMHGLVRHTDDCRWQLARRWRARLLQLAEGMPAEDSGSATEDAGGGESQDSPFVADRGVDTLYVSLFAKEVPHRLVEACSTLKAAAQEEDETVETPWLVLGAPLSMHKAGVGTSATGRGVSWSFILRNARVMLLLRKSPLAGLVASVRLSAEALWTLGPRDALNALRDDFGAMWEGAETGSFEAVRWQLSQIHLCADVARLELRASDVDHLVSRSLKRALHAPAVADLEGAWLGVDGGALDGWDEWAFDAVDALLEGEMAGSVGVSDEWAEVPLAVMGGWEMEDLDGEEGREEAAVRDAGRNDTAGHSMGDADEEPADELGVAVHTWGRRVSGLSFSPGGDLSAVWYDKLLEERLSGKRWMEPIHEAGGWRSGMALTRIEVRFRRGALRDLMALSSAREMTRGSAAGGRDARDASQRWFDDPWTALEHLDDLWAYFAGLPPEGDVAPDVTWRGWMRLVVPSEGDTNRWRWATDPIWHVVQRAGFGRGAVASLVRTPTVRHDLNLVDAELYGLFKSRAALRGEFLEEAATLSLELRDFARCMEEVDQQKGRDFAEEVREKARQMGKPVPVRATFLCDRTPTVR